MNQTPFLTGGVCWGLLAVCGLAVAAQTETVIAENTAWTTDRTLSGNVLVLPEATLTVTPGVTIQCAAGVQILVKGTLVAQGSEQAPVRFVSAAPKPAAGDWAGLVIAPVSPQEKPSQLSGCRVEHAVRGVQFTANAAAPHRMEHCVVQQHREFGIYGEKVKGLIVRGNDVSRCGTAGDKANSGGIVLVECEGGEVIENTVHDGHEQGIWLDRSQGVRVARNEVQHISGDAYKLRGYGIYLAGTQGSQVIDNRVQGVEYIDILLSGSGENLIQGNHCGPACDGICLTGEASVRNQIVDNTIEQCGWSQIYPNSHANDNRFQKITVIGGGWGVTNNCAGGNRYEDCVFDGTYPLNIWGYGGATFVRCTLRNINTDKGRDYWVDVTDNAQATFLDCELDATKIRRRYPTAQRGYVHLLYTLTVTVRDAATDAPLAGAKVMVSPQAVQARENGPPLDPTEAVTDEKGQARIALTFVVMEATSTYLAPARTLTVVSEGFRVATVENVVTHRPTEVTVRLERAK